jgi:hypothetical protein
MLQLLHASQLVLCAPKFTSETLIGKQSSHPGLAITGSRVTGSSPLMISVDLAKGPRGQKPTRSYTSNPLVGLPVALASPLITLIKQLQDCALLMRGDVRTRK